MAVGNQGTDPTEDVMDAIEEAFSGEIPALKLGRQDGVFYVEYPPNEKKHVHRRNILIVAGAKYRKGEDS